MKVKWSRVYDPRFGSHYAIKNSDGKEVVHIEKRDNCGHWYVFVGVDQDEADGDRFDFLWEAKLYGEEQFQRLLSGYRT